MRQAILVKHLLPEWSRTSLTSLPYLLVLREPLTILIETITVAPLAEILRHALIPLYYHVCLTQTVIGMVFVLNKCLILLEKRGSKSSSTLLLSEM